MKLYLCGHGFRYETENLCRVFFPNEEVEVSDGAFPCRTDGISVLTKAEGDTLFVSASAGGREQTREKTVSADTDEGERERELLCILFYVLSELTGYVPPWGILTGVRPSKLMGSLINGSSPGEAKRYFTEKLLVSVEKTELTSAVALREEKIIRSSKPNSFSLYIAIPFCPSRCSYCSFVSHSITGQKAKQLTVPYVELLKRELVEIGKIARELGLKLESVYFGGGTPTVLSAEQIDTICETVEKNFNLSSCREYTVEAGRPDTISKEKLKTLKERGVSRISINPQTMNAEVLNRIGRKHSPSETLDAFYLAREAGFNNINMDLIAGLYGDTTESFDDSLNIIRSLKPESITVHTLALKRSSSLVSCENAEAPDGSTVAEMLKCVQRTLPENGYHPYYMYRQSRSVGNFENVGWCLEGFECIYNVFMMEECHTVLAAGAGAVTKLRRPDSGYIERIFNYKYPYEYISRFDELIERKNRIKTFYSS